MGKWSEAFRQVFPETRLVMVEANPNLNGTLRQVAKRLGHTDVVIAALYNEKAQVPFYISEPTSKGNSVFKEQTEYFEGVQPVKIDALPLDDIARNMGVLDSVDVLKLDVQGAEGVALEGANAILKIASVVTLEMSLVEYNKGGSCYDEVDQRLRSHGFTLYDMLGASHVPHLFNTPGAGQIDAIWVRPSSSVLQKVLKVCATRRAITPALRPTDPRCTCTGREILLLSSYCAEFGRPSRGTNRSVEAGARFRAYCGCCRPRVGIIKGGGKHEFKAFH